MRGFVGINRRCRDDALSTSQRLRFGLEDEGEGLAAPFAHDDNDLALAGLVFAQGDDPRGFLSVWPASHSRRSTRHQPRRGRKLSFRLSAAMASRIL